MSAEEAVEDAWDREPTTGRHLAKRDALSEYELPSHGKERVVFCTCYGDKFDGDNHEEALAYARFCVFYLKGMRMPPFDTEDGDGG